MAQFPDEGVQRDEDQLVGPGLLLTVVGLLLMTGLEANSTWTQLIPGFLVAGAGSGMVNPPLASTAVGVVAPQRSGMASGANTTFRQIGLAVSIAALGSVFTSRLTSGIDDALAGVPTLRGQGEQISDALRRGDGDQLFATTPAGDRGALAGTVHTGFASTINDLLTIGAVIAFAGGICALALIRRKDFLAQGPAPAPVPAPTTGPDGDHRPSSAPIPDSAPARVRVR